MATGGKSFLPKDSFPRARSACDPHGLVLIRCVSETCHAYLSLGFGMMMEHGGSMPTSAKRYPHRVRARSHL